MSAQLEKSMIRDDEDEDYNEDDEEDDDEDFLKKIIDFSSRRVPKLKKKKPIKMIDFIYGNIIKENKKMKFTLSKKDIKKIIQSNYRELASEMITEEKVNEFKRELETIFLEVECKKISPFEMFIFGGNDKKRFRDTILRLSGIPPDSLKRMDDVVTKLIEKKPLDIIEEEDDFSVDKLDTTEDNKKVIKNKMMQGGRTSWIRTIFSYPFNKGNKWYSDDIDIADQLGKLKISMENEIFGLQTIKTRVLQNLAKIMVNKNINVPVLCLKGPPGVGKTFFAKVIAETIGIPFEIISLGGVGDPLIFTGAKEIWCGSGPSIIISSIIKLKTDSCIIVLDEIDKTGAVSGGIPLVEHALLHFFDETRNKLYEDSFFENIRFDLSKIIFIATMNDSTGMDRALLDRLDIVNIKDYTAKEKEEIIKRYILPKFINELKITPEDIIFSSAIIEKIVEKCGKTGLRLAKRIVQRTLANINLKVVMKELKYPIEVTLDQIEFPDEENTDKPPDGMFL